MAEDVAKNNDQEGHQKSQESWRKTNTVFTNSKAGMDGVNKDHVKKVIYEMSKDSPHFKNEQRKQQQTEARISRLLAKAKHLSAQDLAGHTRKMDEKMAKLVAQRDLTRTWIHLDMDAFFASVEELYDPQLKTVPMGVGGIGMLSTTNYVARKFGVRSAMPGFIALQLCPKLVIVKPNFQRYTEASSAVKQVLKRYDEDLHSASLDEAHLDVTSYCHQHGLTGSEVAEEMRQKVFEETGLTCSCGIAPNRMLAKICSDMNKPNGQCAVSPDPDQIKSFMAVLPIRKVPGIGKVAEQQLNALGVQTCADLLRLRGTVSALFSEITADFTLAAALGLCSTTHQPPAREGEVGRKGIGCERTFAVISQPKDLEAKCCELAAKLAADMQQEGLKAKTLTLKLKAPTFELKTRAVSLPGYISTAQEISCAALGLLRAELPISVRLMGLRMSSFAQTAPPPGQPSVASFLIPKQGVNVMEEGEEVSDDEGPDAAQKEEIENVQPALSATQRPPKSASLWACAHCTFAENSHHFLRCMICDSRRGTTPECRPAVEDPPLPLNAQAAVFGGSYQASADVSSRQKTDESSHPGDTSLVDSLLPTEIAPKSGGQSSLPLSKQDGNRSGVSRTERQNMRKRKAKEAAPITHFFQASRPCAKQ